MEKCGDAFAERGVAGDFDQSAGMSSGDASGVDSADEIDSISGSKIMTGDWSSDSLWSSSVACTCCEDLR